jgi:aminoglycoside phosphotransferase family enzyme/predicted kinase
VARIDVVETHISWVFLLGDDVYKVKKPVSLGFLDFRSLEARKAACEAEVELNARLAPGVYKGVVPILKAGDVMDYAVHMTRLSDDRRADKLLERGELSGNDIDRVAERIARFHQQARCDEQTSSFGTPEAIAVNVRENFAQTRESEYAAEIEHWQTSFLRDRADLFARRIAAKRVRDGHGDLRLEHVYLDPLLVIDCIEFNERFRFADVCSDIAFLSMDLAWHGRVDLAERLLARYARESNDFDLYSVVDFYQSYRAYVRGKIATIVHDEAQARRYFRLALASERPWLLPAGVVAVGGIIASGKSTVAEAIAEMSSAPIVDADRTRKFMVGAPATTHVNDPAWQGAYDPAFTEEVYAEVLRRADVVLASGRPVILDASFRSPSMRAAARALARKHGVPFRFVECQSDLATCRARLERRERERTVSDGRLAILDSFAARWEPVVELPGENKDEHVVLDTTMPLEETIRRVRERLETWPLGFVA